MLFRLRRIGGFVDRRRRDPGRAHRLDVLVQGQVIVDLKTIKAFEDVHFAVVRSQLRAAGLKHGLLLNFAGVKLQIKRVIAG